jgi:tetratricopeptide (TPR) repeat protein
VSAPLRGLALGVLATAGVWAQNQTPVATPLAPPAVQTPTGAPELLLDQGRRAFDALQYDQAVPVFDRLVGALTAGGQILRPDLLVQAYELRARARFALGDPSGTEQDFSSLLLIKPDFVLGAGISPRVVAVLDSVRRLTIGQITASLQPAGDVQIDGRTYQFPSVAQTIDFPAGEHQLNAARPGYRPIAQRFTVTAGETATLTLILERVSATIAVVSSPEGVDVIFDGTSRGQTSRGPETDTSLPMIIGDIATGTHRLQLRKACFKDLERTIAIDHPDDLQTGTLRLTPALANVTIRGSETGIPIFVDGAARGQSPAEFTVCEGTHTIELKGPAGRFVDRRDWKTGDNVTLVAELRSAFPIVLVKAPSAALGNQARLDVERALAGSKRAIVYAPSPAELDAALAGENVPADWLVADPPDAGAATSRIPKGVRLDVGRRIASKLGAQGVASVSAGPDPYTAYVSILASGSDEPEVITVSRADSAALARAVGLVGAPLPPLVVPSIETSLVDVAGTPGAVVVRATGAGAKAGLAVGDLIVSADGSPVTSTSDLRTRIANAKPASQLSLDVKGPNGSTRHVDVPVTMVPDTIPLRTSTFLYNRALLDLEDALKNAITPLERSAAHLNLAIVHMRLGNCDAAITELKEAQFPDGPGVSSGTVSYLNGLCFEALGRTADAQAAFVKAASAPLARLSFDGPLIAPLAQQKLARR